MNLINLYRKRNEILNFLRPMNRHINCLRWHSGESDNHIQMKLEICKYLKKNEIHFVTEGIFSESGQRGDVIVLDWGVCIEVYETEGKESLESKSKTYPLPVIFVKADQKFNEKLIL